MAEMVNFQLMELPRVYVVGKQFVVPVEEMGKNNPLPGFWDICFGEDIFTTLEKQADRLYSQDYVGLMIDWYLGDRNMTYIVGMLAKEDFVAPEGFARREIAPTTAAVGWVKGKDVPEVCRVAHELTEKKLTEAGYTSENMLWCMEYYAEPRFSEPDENGEVILDYYIPCVKKG